jgi:hypothetical protein
MNRPVQPYNTRIQKGGALLDDMRMLVRSWEEDNTETRMEVRRLLGKKTLARSQDTMVRSFAPRFLQGNPPNAWKIVRLLEDRNTDLEILRPVYYWITARNDRLLYEFVTEELIHVAGSGDGSIRIEETTTWISAHIKRGGQEWTPTVTLKVGRGILAALRDFGILEGGTKKQVAPIHLPMEAFCYIAFWLGRLGYSGESLVRHSDWGLFLFSPKRRHSKRVHATHRRWRSHQRSAPLGTLAFLDGYEKGMARTGRREIRLGAPGHGPLARPRERKVQNQQILRHCPRVEMKEVSKWIRLDT